MEADKENDSEEYDEEEAVDAGESHVRSTKKKPLSRKRKQTEKSPEDNMLNHAFSVLKEYKRKTLCAD